MHGDQLLNVGALTASSASLAMTLPIHWGAGGSAVDIPREAADRLGVSLVVVRAGWTAGGGMPLLLAGAP
jgi:hypothetical protein